MPYVFTDRLELNPQINASCLFFKNYRWHIHPTFPKFGFSLFYVFADITLTMRILLKIFSDSLYAFIFQLSALWGGQFTKAHSHYVHVFTMVYNCEWHLIADNYSKIVKYSLNVWVFSVYLHVAC